MVTNRDDEKTAALGRARSAQGRFEMAQKWRDIRNEELVAAFDAGATLAELAEMVGLDQHEVSSVLRCPSGASPE